MKPTEYWYHEDDNYSRDAASKSNADSGFGPHKYKIAFARGFGLALFIRKEEMTDEEKIEQAAEKHGREYFKKRDLPGPGSTHDAIFKGAVQWRDQNPNPKVLALVEALKIEAKFLTMRGMLPIPKHIQQALAEWEEK